MVREISCTRCGKSFLGNQNAKYCQECRKLRIEASTMPNASKLPSPEEFKHFDNQNCQVQRTVERWELTGKDFICAVCGKNFDCWCWAMNEWDSYNGKNWQAYTMIYHALCNKTTRVCNRTTKEVLLRTLCLK